MPDDIEEYSAPSKEFKEKMRQIGVALPDIHKEYSIPHKYRDYSHLQSRLMTKINKWENYKISDESFYQWQLKLAKRVKRRNPTLKPLIDEAIANDEKREKNREFRPELTHLLHGVISQYNETDISYYLKCKRTKQDNEEFISSVNSKVQALTSNKDFLPEWVISESTARIINNAIDQKVKNKISPENFEKKKENSSYLKR